MALVQHMHLEKDRHLCKFFWRLPHMSVYRASPGLFEWRQPCML